MLRVTSNDRLCSDLLIYVQDIECHANEFLSLAVQFSSDADHKLRDVNETVPVAVEVEEHLLQLHRAELNAIISETIFLQKQSCYMNSEVFEINYILIPTLAWSAFYPHRHP